jgi:hypothetical protein
MGGLKLVQAAQEDHGNRWMWFAMVRLGCGSSPRYCRIGRLLGEVVSPTVSPAVDKAARSLPNWFALGADA